MPLLSFFLFIIVVSHFIVAVVNVNLNQRVHSSHERVCIHHTKYYWLTKKKRSTKEHLFKCSFFSPFSIVIFCVHIRAVWLSHKHWCCNYRIITFIVIINQQIRKNICFVTLPSAHHIYDVSSISSTNWWSRTFTHFSTQNLI